MIYSKEALRAAIKRVVELGETDFDRACESVAQSKGIPVEQVREAAYQGDAQEGAAAC
jgi:hypothetical protein